MRDLERRSGAILHVSSEATSGARRAITIVGDEAARTRAKVLIDEMTSDEIVREVRWVDQRSGTLAPPGGGEGQGGAGLVAVTAGFAFLFLFFVWGCVERAWPAAIGFSQRLARMEDVVCLGCTH